MTTPQGFRTESNRTPKASRAGALYATQRYSTLRQENPAEGRIHRLGSRRDQARVIAARHTPTTATMDGSLRELRGGGC